MKLSDLSHASRNLDSSATILVKRPALGVDKIAPDLDDRRLVGPCGDTKHLADAVGKADHEKHVVSRQSPARPDFDTEEVTGRERLREWMVLLLAGATFPVLPVSLS